MFWLTAHFILDNCPLGSLAHNLLIADTQQQEFMTKYNGFPKSQQVKSCFERRISPGLPTAAPTPSTVPMLLKLDDVKAEQPVPHGQQAVHGFSCLCLKVVVESAKGGLEVGEVHHRRPIFRGKDRMDHLAFLHVS